LTHFFALNVCALLVDIRSGIWSVNGQCNYTRVALKEQTALSCHSKLLTV